MTNFILRNDKDHNLAKNKPVILKGITEISNQLLMETLYKIFFERAKEAVIVFNEEGLIIVANPKTEETFGYAKGELKDTNILDLISPEFQFDFILRYKSILTEERPNNDTRYFFSGICKNKVLVPLSIYMQNHIKLENKTLIFGEITNESENLEVKKKLNDSELRFSKIFYSTPVAHSLVSVKAGIIVDVNEYFLKLMEYDRSEIINKSRENITLFYKRSDQEKYRYKIENQKEIHDSEEVLVTKTGKLKKVVLSSIVINFNEEDHYLTSLVDITEKKRVEVELKESEERFVKAFTENPVALSINDSANHTHIAVNTSYQKMLGYTKNELLGKDFTDIQLFNHPNDYLKIRLLQNKQLHINNYETELKKKSGEIIIVQLSIETIKLKNRDFILSTFIDITDKKKAEKDLLLMNERIEFHAEEKLKQSKELFFKIFELSQVPISIIEVETGLILNINPACEKLYCYKKEELVNKTWTELGIIRPRDHKEIIAKSPLNADQSKNIEVKIKTGAGKSKDVLLSIDLINLDNKKCCLVTSFDFSDRKKIEESLKNALQKEKESSDMKSRFVSMASHQFRTPLTTILSSADILSLHIEKGDVSNSPKHLKRIKTSVSNLTSLLNEFLSLDKLENHKMKVTNETFDLKNFAMTVLDEMQPSLKKGQQIDYLHKGEELIKSDKMVLQNIMMNLLSNASKYSAENKKIELITSNMNGSITIQIKDHGIGIPEEEKDKIFSRLFRAKNAEVIEGTGLGLNIVKSYAELLNGTVYFTSKENVGTTFTVEFPN